MIKSKYLLIITSITILIVLFPVRGCLQENPRGKYMGQEPPGMKPEIFAPGFISVDGSELNSVFTPDGKEFYYAVSSGRKHTIKYTKQVNGVWINPETAPFSGVFSDVDISISYDGEKCFFGSNRPVTTGGKRLTGRSNLWMIERQGDGWGEPVHLKYGINDGRHQNYPCPAANGNLYFQSEREGCLSKETDIYMAEWKNGKYLEPVNLGPNINSIYKEGDVLIAPDESWIIISVSGSPECIGSGDFFISFRNDDGSWAKRIHMGEEINTKTIEFCPMLSPDRKYLLYSSQDHISWVDIGIIEKYRPKSSSTGEIRGPYLGQEPPGLTPEIFAPGIISTNDTERSSWFSEDGNTFIFSRWGGDRTGIFITEQVNGIWSKPERFPHMDPEYDGDFLLSPDGDKLVFSSQRPLETGGKKLRNCYIYLMEKKDNKWQKPVRLGPEVNSGMHDSYPCLTADHTLYFFSRRSGGHGKADTYRAKLLNGRYSSVENVGYPLNTEYIDLDAFVAPDESYMILCSDRPGGYGKEDLYISFKQMSGKWTEPVNMGKEFNSSGSEWIPYVTPDGKYLFFTSNKKFDKSAGMEKAPGNGKRNIFWVDAGVIEKFRPEKGK